MGIYTEHVQLTLEEANKIKNILNKIVHSSIPLDKDLFYDLMWCKEILIEKGATK